MDTPSTPSPMHHNRSILNGIAEVHTISLYLNDKPGVLGRLSQVFARRGYNIESLIVSPAAQGGYSRMTITCSGDPETLQQIINQLSKLVDVVHATDSTDRSTVQCELALVKLVATVENRSEILQIADHFEAKVVDFERDSIILRICGASEKVNNFIALLSAYPMVELVRTGKVVMARGADLT